MPLDAKSLTELIRNACGAQIMDIKPDGADHALLILSNGKVLRAQNLELHERLDLSRFVDPFELPVQTMVGVDPSSLPGCLGRDEVIETGHQPS